MLIILLLLFGLIIGSFLNAAVYRLHKKQSFVTGRSRCEACGHTLAASDLIPVVSWLLLKGRCRYCGRSVSWQHPVVELATGLVLAASYVWWPANLQSPGQAVLFIGWLAVALGLIALAVYDLRYLLLPNKIIYPTLLVAVVARSIYIIGYRSDYLHQFLAWAASLVVASGLFFAIFAVSRGRWIGYGDVRLGLVTGTVLADPAQAFLMIFAASLLGSALAGAQIIVGQRTWRAKIAFGPFLIAGTLIALLFGPAIINWYGRLFMG